jgi:HrpA-like RNA helicase
LNNKPYSELNKIRIKDKMNNIIEKDYFDLLKEDFDWYTFYALDWISQINFFHHYLNHRVLYITGATGTGKSTQVPKLLMYALKSIDYKINGKVICTQPRITPTQGNAVRISDELGLPIEQDSYTTKVKINTDNYFIQYKHQRNNHQKDNCNHLTLKMVTDGTLYEIIKKNLPMKQKFYSKNKNKWNYSLENEYDIIIVDEAHEHNTNMDLILTLGRQTCYYNNDIKLIIISATMTDDDPIYRCYYKYINDNLVYPLKNKFFHPFLYNYDNKYKQFICDSLFMDRRYHISPPQETTQYQIDEYYLPFSIIKENNSHEENSDLTQEKSYEIIKNICSESNIGDILLFVNGVKEINNAVKYLNNNLPEGNIALPYYSEFNSIYKDIIENIDVKINSIKTKK